MKLNFTQRRKKKNFREKQDNKNLKMCYTCDKSSCFVKDCRLKNLMILRQINVILREILNSQNDVKKQSDTKTHISKIKSNNV